MSWSPTSRPDPSMYTRRRFVQTGASALAAGLAVYGARAQDEIAGSPQAIRATLRIEPAALIFMLPGNFTGLSYESAQLANPAFFSAENKGLIQLFRELSPQGVLRLGVAPPSTPPLPNKRRPGRHRLRYLARTQARLRRRGQPPHHWRFAISALFSTPRAGVAFTA